MEMIRFTRNYNYFQMFATILVAIVILFLYTEIYSNTKIIINFNKLKKKFKEKADYMNHTNITNSDLIQEIKIKNNLIKTPPRLTPKANRFYRAKSRILKGLYLQKFCRKEESSGKQQNFSLKQINESLLLDSKNFTLNNLYSNPNCNNTNWRLETLLPGYDLAIHHYKPTSIYLEPANLCEKYILPLALIGVISHFDAFGRREIVC